MTSEEHLARELRLLRVSIEKSNDLIAVQILPAIDGLDNRLIDVEGRVADHETRLAELEDGGDTDEIAIPEPPPLLPWWVFLTAFCAAVLAVGATSFLWSHS